MVQLLPLPSDNKPLAATAVCHRIGFGVLDIGNPEETFRLTCVSLTDDPSWWDPWPVLGDPSKPGCYLYTAGPKDTISGMADHFNQDILIFIEDNTQRRIIPTRKLGKPPRNEPQLQGPSGGAVFRVCDILADSFERVAKGEERYMMSNTLPGMCVLQDAHHVLLRFAACAVTCGRPPARASISWPADCTSTSGSECTGSCAEGFTGSLTATCGNNGLWAVAGSGCTRGGRLVLCCMEDCIILGRLLEALLLVSSILICC